MVATAQGLSTDTPGRLVLDAGAIWRDEGAAGEELVGATRGGAVFTVEKDDRMIEVDGAGIGPIKELRRPIRHTARLEATFVEMSLQTFLDLTRGTAVSDGTIFTITPDNAIATADYYENITWVGTIKGSGTAIKIRILNGLAVGEWSVTTDDQDEGVLPIRWDAHYDLADLDTTPYSIEVPISVS